MFQAGTVYSGVPAGCFYTGTVNGWNSTCSQGRSIHTQAEWANTVFNMYPSYSGPRPRMKIFHGSADTTLYPQNYQETIKQWTGVFGYSMSNPTAQSGVPGSQYTTYTYGPKVVGVYGQGVGHGVPVMGDEDMKFFCLDGSCTEGYDDGGSGGSGGGGGGGGGGQTTTTTAPPPPTNTGGTNCASRWGQCGGLGWTGSTCCVSGSTCTYLNDWYSQCL